MLQFIKVSNNQVVNVSQIISALYSAKPLMLLITTTALEIPDVAASRSVQLTLLGDDAERVWQRLLDVSTN